MHDSLDNANHKIIILNLDESSDRGAPPMASLYARSTQILNLGLRLENFVIADHTTIHSVFVSSKLEKGLVIWYTVKTISQTALQTRDLLKIFIWGDLFRIL